MDLKQDYKIATKTIAHRLEKVLEHDSVHPTQTDYLQKKTYVTVSMLTLKRFFTKSNSKTRRSG